MVVAAATIEVAATVALEVVVVSEVVLPVGFIRVAMELREVQAVGVALPMTVVAGSVVVVAVVVAVEW